MTMSSFQRFLGLCAMVTGILFLSLSVWYNVSLEEFGSYINLIGMVLLPLGLLGLYFRQMNEVGKFGFFSFIIAFIGAILWAGHGWVGAFVVPVLDELAPEILTETPELIVTGINISLFSFFIGLVLFGLVTAWKGVLPRWGALIFVVVPILDFIPYGFYVAQPLAGVGLIWLGYYVWKGND